MIVTIPVNDFPRYVRALIESDKLTSLEDGLREEFETVIESAREEAEGVAAKAAEQLPDGVDGGELAEAGKRLAEGANKFRRGGASKGSGSPLP